MPPEIPSPATAPPTPAGGGGLRRRLTAAVGKDWVQLVRGSGFIFTCRVGGAVLVLVTQWVLARWMGAEDLGSYLLAYSWLIIVARLSGLGFNSAAPRFIGEGVALGDRAKVRGFAVFSGRTVLVVSTAAGILGVAGTLLVTAASGGNPWPLVIAFATVPVMALIGVLQGFAVSYSWFRAAFIPNALLRPALFLGVVSGLWWMGRSASVSFVMLVQLASMALALALLFWFVHRPLRHELAGAGSRVEVRAWTGTAVALLVISLFRDYLPELSIIVADLYLAPEEIAVFSIAFKIAALIAFVLFAVDSFIIPQMARAAAVGDRAGLQAFAQRAAWLSFLASLGAFVGFWLWGRWALALFGEEFVSGYRLLLILSAAQVLRAGMGPVLPLLTVGGHERESLKVFGVSLALVGPSVMLLAPLWGAEGVAAAVTGVIVLSSLALSHRVLRLMGVHSSVLTGWRAPAPPAPEP